MKKTRAFSKPEWNLHGLVRDEKQFSQIEARIRKKTTAFMRYRTLLEKKPSRELVENALRDLEEISLLGGKLSIYAMLLFSQNTQDERAKALQSRVSQFLAEQGNKKVFFGIWWKNLDEKTVRRLLPKNPEYAYHMRDARRFRKHILSEKEEQLVSLKDTTGSEALMRLYNLITSAHAFEWRQNGKTSTLTEEELSVHHRSPDPRIRVRSYDLRWKKYEEKNGILGEIYKNIVLDTRNEAIGLRKYDSPISIRNMDNHLPDDVVEKFMQVCTQNTDVFHDYFAWKSTHLGVKNSRYHIYAPLTTTQEHVPFEKGYARVMQTFKEFSPWFAQQAARVRNEKRIDYSIRPGKDGGGFCVDVPHETSFVHMNYANTHQDMNVLAHELGHAVHHHAGGHHSLYTMSPGLPLSETASTFAELLLSDSLARETRDVNTQRSILAQQMDEAYSSIPRQVYFCRFEQEAFDLLHAGKTIPDLNEAYYRNLRTQLGSRMELPHAVQYEWAAIPHLFAHPFYVYAYAFGQLLVYALYERYQKEGMSFVKDYQRFLAAGGSQDPEDVLRDIGFDARKRSSWQAGFDLLRTKLKTLQKMSD